MDIAMSQGVNLDLDNKIRATVDKFKMDKIEKMLSDAFESLPNESPIDLIGELNKYDIMH